MKKTFTTLSALLLLSATLAACNTDTNEPATTAAKEEQTAQKTEPVTATQQKTEPSSTEQKVEQTNKQTQTDSQQKENEATLTYVSNEQTMTENVTTSTSEEMNYTIAHFENFTLEAEDPGIDHLFFNDDDSLSMQIEVVAKEEKTFDDVKASALDTMSVLSADVKELDFAAILEHRTDIINMVGYETVFEETDKVVKVVFERDNLLVTLTIYDTVEADLQDAFLQMGLTIK